MRLNPGIALDYADDVLRRAEMTWTNARGGRDFYRAYTDAVHDTYPTLKQVFASPDVGGGLRSTAYWNLLRLGGTHSGMGFISDPDVAANLQIAIRAENQALTAEIEMQLKTLELARVELEALKDLAARPGLPVVYDTNMLNHWRQAGDVRWRELFKAQGEDIPFTRLVVPLRVIDELDRQKYGNGELARRAATAIRYLERVTKSGEPGRPVQLRPDASLEIWMDTDDSDDNADLSILRCATDLAKLQQGIRVRVLTADIGMRLRAQNLSLTVMRLPDDHRKKGTALDDGPVEQE